MNIPESQRQTARNSRWPSETLSSVFQHDLNDEDEDQGIYEGGGCQENSDRCKTLFNMWLWEKGEPLGSMSISYLCRCLPFGGNDPCGVGATALHTYLYIHTYSIYILIIHIFRQLTEIQYGYTLNISCEGRNKSQNSDLDVYYEWISEFSSQNGPGIQE